MTQPVRGAVRERDGNLVPSGLRASAEWTWRILVVAAGIYLLLRLLAEFKVLVVPVLVALLVVCAHRAARPVRDPPARHAASSWRRSLTLLFVLLALAGLVYARQPAGGHRLPEPAEAVRPKGSTDVRYVAPRTGPSTSPAEQIDTWIDQAQASLKKAPTAAVLLTPGARLGVASTAADVGSRPLHRPVQQSSLPGLRATRSGASSLACSRAAARPTGEGGCRPTRGSTLTAYVRATVIVAAVDAIRHLGSGGGRDPRRALRRRDRGAGVLGAFVPMVGAPVTGRSRCSLTWSRRASPVAVIMLGVVVARPAARGPPAPAVPRRPCGRSPPAGRHPRDRGRRDPGRHRRRSLRGAVVAVGHVVSVYLRDGDGGPGQNAPPGDRAPETPREDAADVGRTGRARSADAPCPRLRYATLPG